MIIKFSETTKIESVEGVVWDYPINKEIGIAYQQLNMRGPVSGDYLNKVCHEIYFIIEGRATFYIKGKGYEVEPKDVIIVEPNTAHHIETGGVKYITITRPDWYEEQYVQV